MWVRKARLYGVYKNTYSVWMTLIINSWTEKCRNVLVKLKQWEKEHNGIDCSHEPPVHCRNGGGLWWMNTEEKCKGGKWN